MNNKISAIILAAGLSSRMGMFKPVMQIGSTSLLEHAVNVFLSSGINNIRIVTGFRGGELPASFKNLKVSWIYNADYIQGMISSVRAGIGSLGECAAFFILPVDIPLVQNDTIRLLLDAYISEKGDIIYPVFRGIQGYPLLISVIYINELLSQDNSCSLTDFIHEHKEKAFSIPVLDEAVLLDCDTMHDYENLKKYYKSRFRE